jgi:hypothetical protein
MTFAQVLLAAVLWVEAPEHGSLRVKTDVAEAEVFLDGKSLGKTPLTLDSMPAGTYRLTLTKPGYEDHQQEVRVQAGAAARVFAIMKALPSTTPTLPAQFHIIHQHRAGACSGSLTVTAEAVDYRSHDGKDVFHLPIRDIRSVSRSMGALPSGGAPLFWGVPNDNTGCRLEVPGRSFGFFAYEEDPKLAGTPAENRVKVQDTGPKTKELFELVYRLWMDSLDQKLQKPAAK